MRDHAPDILKAICTLNHTGSHRLRSTFSKEMKIKSKALKRAVIVLLLLALVSAVGILTLARPLLPSDDYQVTAVVNGSSVDAQLLKPFPFGSYYVKLGDVPDRTLNWFGVAFGRKSAFSPVGIYSSRFGFDYMHADQDKGVVLTDGKMEDNWTVEFTDSGVRFQNSSTLVSLTK